MDGWMDGWINQYIDISKSSSSPPLVSSSLSPQCTLCWQALNPIVLVIRIFMLTSFDSSAPPLIRRLCLLYIPHPISQLTANNHFSLIRLSPSSRSLSLAIPPLLPAHPSFSHPSSSSSSFSSFSSS